MTFSALSVAQSDKTISYSVPVPVTKTEVASSSAPSVYKAPEPLIRPISEASTTPPSTATKKNRDKNKTNNVEEMSEKKVEKTQAKSETKSEAKAKATSANTKSKKAAAENPPKKNDTRKVQKSEPVKSSVVTKPIPAKPEAEKTTDLTKTSVSSSMRTATIEPKPIASALNSPSNLSTPVKIAGAAAVTAVAANQLATKNDDADNEIEDGNAIDDEASNDDPEPVLANAVPLRINNSPLPMSSQRAGFVNTFKNYVETRIAPNVPGLAVAVIANGKIEVLQAYGVKKYGGQDPITTDTAFRLASVSKTIAGTTAGVLVHDGLITWDTPITSVLPNVEFNNTRYGNQLTLRNIMSQSTGLPTHSGDNYIEDGMPYDDVVEKLKPINFVCPPGKCYAYQNVTFSLLANIVRKKTGKSYEQYVKEKLFAPLGMHSASIGMEGLLATNNYALPHVLARRGRWYTEKITENYYRLNPAAGGNASITDMSRWVLAQMGHNPDVLPASVLNSIHAKVTKNTPAQSHYGAQEGVTDTHYGMGWRTFDYRGDKNFLHHGGYVLGFRSEMVFNPELQIGMVILSNCNKMSGDIVFKFLDAYEDEKRGEKRFNVIPHAPAKKKK